MSAAEKNPVVERQQGQVISSTDRFIEQAIQSQAPVETLERLFALKERHEASEARKSFYQAMQKFQKIKPTLPKTDAVSFGNGKAAYKFCPLDEIEKRLRDPLDECGLSYRFENLRGEDGSIGVRCIVSHVQGHSEVTEMFAPGDDSGNKNTIQQIGSTTSYLRRYSLTSAFALVTADEDDDGQAAGDAPYINLLMHNKAVRENWEAITAIKEAIRDEDYEQMAMYWCELSDAVKNNLWTAPTRGGIFETRERDFIKSDEGGKARKAYLEAKQAS